jgi:hypothetical protein
MTHEWQRTEQHDPRERIAEIGEILALGLVRLRARQSSSLSAASGEGFVDCLGTPSGVGVDHLENAPK